MSLPLGIYARSPRCPKEIGSVGPRVADAQEVDACTLQDRDPTRIDSLEKKRFGATLFTRNMYRLT